MGAGWSWLFGPLPHQIGWLRRLPPWRQANSSVASSRSFIQTPGPADHSPLCSPDTSSLPFSISSKEEGSTLSYPRLSSPYDVDRLPEYQRDSDYHGKEYETELRCNCGRRLVRRIASSGSNIGRRFLGCPNKRLKCYFVKWVDPEWDGRAATAIRMLSERNDALQISLNGKNMDFVLLEWSKIREDGVMRQMLANAKKDHADEVCKMKLASFLVMVTLFYVWLYA